MNVKVLVPLLLTACATQPELGEDSDAITDETSALAQDYYRLRAVKTANGTGGCTATRISARFALTAAHCLAKFSNSDETVDMLANVGNDVLFYKIGPFSTTGEATIAQRFVRTGVSTASCYHGDACSDSTGNFADIALLRLDDQAGEDTDLEGAIATLAWKFPGDGAPGKAIGAGRHNGQANPNKVLRQSSDTLASDDDDDGWFKTSEAQTNPGDSGGPFYVGNKVVGVLAGVGAAGLDTWGKYTSVPHHLTWILQTIGYHWRGQPAQTNTWYAGDLIESASISELACQYACERTTSCEAYNFQSDLVASCGLYENVTHANTQTGWKGALKHGRSAASNEVVGYIRNDGTNAVVHANNAGRIREIALENGAWESNAIHPGVAPNVSGDVTAFKRNDGTDGIYYRSAANQIIEVAHVGNSWQAFDLTSAAGGPPAAGAPVAYVRSDGVSTVVYRSTSGRIIELKLGSGGSWLSTDLTTLCGSSVTASSNPSAFVRSDNINSIVFRAGTHIWEFYQPLGGAWSCGVPSALTSTSPPPAASKPAGYARTNGTNAIVYRSTTNTIVELSLISGQWYWQQLATGAAGDPAVYVRTDTKEIVLFRDASGDIIERSNGNGWSSANLTSITNAASYAGNPAVYHRRDGYNIILYENPGHLNDFVNEIHWRRGQAAWGASDLTTLSGETP
jgi:Trypsin